MGTYSSDRSLSLASTFSLNNSYILVLYNFNSHGPAKHADAGVHQAVGLV